MTGNFAAEGLQLEHPVTPRTPGPRGGRRLLQMQARSQLSLVLTLAIIAMVIAALNFASEVFVPLAISVLLSFTLAPPVRWLRRMRVPNVPAVLIVVTVAGIVILAFGWMVTQQVADLAQRLPAYQMNIETKIDTLQESPPGGQLFQRAARMLRDIGRRIEEEQEEQEEAIEAETGEPEPEPMPVVIDEPEPDPMELIRSILGPLLGPLATAGIVIVFVIFMLLKREDLRDRLIRLVARGDLPRTTQALDDAARRVGQYLFMQLVVNTTYGIPIGVGLWLIGLPNPVLWGLLCIVLRFIPYVGPVIAAIFPLALAVAVDPGWSTLVWAGALFIVIELISNNVIEPWLYGASTGLSPVAVIAAAVFWTWLWGPIGLLLSTPLTVCLVVLGRHVPQLAFFDVLFGDEPALSAPEQLYQRLLVGVADEATESAEDSLREHTLADFYDDVAVPALALAENDRTRGHLSEEQMLRVADSAATLIDNLWEWEDVEPASDDAAQDAKEADPLAALTSAIDTDKVVLCGGARSVLDDASAAMLGQLLSRAGANVQQLTFRSLHPSRLREMEFDDVGTAVLCYMNADALAHARFLVRRLRRRLPKAEIILGLWTLTPEDLARRDPLQATGADRIVTSVAEALEALLGTPAGRKETEASTPRLVAAER